MSDISAPRMRLIQRRIYGVVASKYLAETALAHKIMQVKMKQKKLRGIKKRQARHGLHTASDGGMRAMLPTDKGE